MMQPDIVFDIGLNVLHLLTHAVAALLLGVAKELNRLNSKRFSFADFSVNALISFIVGGFSYLPLAYYSVNILLSLFISGIIGWMGGNAMDFAAFVLKKFTAKKLDVAMTVDEEVKHSELVNKGKE